MRRLPYSPGELFACQWPECRCEEGVCKAAPELIEVTEQCVQCHRMVLITSSGVCADCQYVNRSTESKPR